MRTRKHFGSAAPARWSAWAPALATAAMVVAAAQPASAATRYWDTNGATAGLGVGGPYDWTADNKWNTNSTGGSGTLGGWANGDSAYFNGNGGSTVTVNTNVTATGVYLGNAPANNSNVTVNFSGSATLTQNGGTDYFGIGWTSGGASNNVHVTFNQSGGTINARATEVGRFGTNATFNLTDGSFNVTGTILRIGNNTYNGAGSGTAANGLVHIDGGSLTSTGVSGTLVGVSGVSSSHASGTLTLDSGSFTGNSVTLASGNYVTGTVNLNGGVFTVGSINSTGTTAATSIFNLNGGTLTAASDTSTFLQGLTTANVRNGGAVLDTAGFNITIAQSLLHSTIGGDAATDGGLAKLGSGTLTLTGADSYTGNTLVEAGTLSLAHADLDDTAAVIVSTDAVLDLTFSGTDLVGSLSYNGVDLGPGLYNAGNTSFITGGGSLRVIPTPAGLTGGLLLLGLMGADRRRSR